MARAEAQNAASTRSARLGALEDALIAAETRLVKQVESLTGDANLGPQARSLAEAVKLLREARRL